LEVGEITQHPTDPEALRTAVFRKMSLQVTAAEWVEQGGSTATLQIGLCESTSAKWQGRPQGWSLQSLTQKS
jgi:hypothetical protein